MPNTYPRTPPTLYLGPTISRYYCETCDEIVLDDAVTAEWQDDEHIASIARHDVCGEEVEYHDDVPLDDEGNEIDDASEADEQESEG